MILRRTLLASLGLTLSLAAGSAAQQPQNVPAPGEPGRPESIERMRREQRGPGGEHRRSHGPGLFKLEGELALTDAQKEQLRAIHQRQFESTKSLREELFTLREKRRAGTLTEDDGVRARTLHQEMRASMETVKNEVESILTPAQRAKVEELKLERKEGRTERMERRKASPKIH